MRTERKSSGARSMTTRCRERSGASRTLMGRARGGSGATRRNGTNACSTWGCAWRAATISGSAMRSSATPASSRMRRPSALRRHGMRRRRSNRRATIKPCSRSRTSHRRGESVRRRRWRRRSRSSPANATLSAPPQIPAGCACSAPPSRRAPSLRRSCGTRACPGMRPSTTASWWTSWGSARAARGRPPALTSSPRGCGRNSTIRPRAWTRSRSSCRPCIAQASWSTRPAGGSWPSTSTRSSNP